MDGFDLMMLEPPPCPDPMDKLAPPSLAHPRLAMLDEATVLHLTSQDSLASVKVPYSSARCRL